MLFFSVSFAIIVGAVVQEESSSSLAPNLAAACGLKTTLSKDRTETYYRYSTTTTDLLTSKSYSQYAAGRLLVDGYTPVVDPTLNQGLYCFRNMSSTTSCRGLDSVYYRTEILDIFGIPQPFCFGSGDFSLTLLDSLYYGGTSNAGLTNLTAEQAQLLQSAVQGTAALNGFFQNYFNASILYSIGISSAKAAQILKGLDPATPGLQAKLVFQAVSPSGYIGPSVNYQLNQATLPAIIFTEQTLPLLHTSLDKAVTIEEGITLFLKLLRSDSLANSLPRNEGDFLADYQANGDISSALVGDTISKFAGALALGKGNLQNLPTSSKGNPYHLESGNFQSGIWRAANGSLCGTGGYPNLSGYLDHCHSGFPLMGPLYKHNAASHWAVFPGTDVSGNLHMISGGSDLASTTLVNILYTLAMVTSEIKAWKAALYSITQIPGWGMGYTINHWARDLLRYYAQYSPTDLHAVRYALAFQRVNPFFEALPPHIPTAMTLAEFLSEFEVPLPASTSIRGVAFGNDVSTPPTVAGTFNGWLNQHTASSTPPGTNYLAVRLSPLSRLYANSTLQVLDTTGTFSTSAPVGNPVYQAGNAGDDLVDDVSGTVIFVPKVGTSAGFRYMQQRYWQGNSHPASTAGIHYAFTHAVPNGFHFEFTNVSPTSATLSIVDPSAPSGASYSATISIQGLADQNCLSWPCIVTLPSTKRGLFRLWNFQRNVSGVITNMPDYLKPVAYLSRIPTTVAGVAPNFSNINNLSSQPWGATTFAYTYPSIPNLAETSTGFANLPYGEGTMAMTSEANKMFLKSDGFTAEEGEDSDGSGDGGLSSGDGGGPPTGPPPCGFACPSPD